jgi:hypothetical protein
MVLQDTLGDAVILSVFDFAMGFVVLFFIGVLIRGLKYVEIIDRGKPGPEVRVRSSVSSSRGETEELVRERAVQVRKKTPDASA